MKKYRVEFTDGWIEIVFATDAECAQEIAVDNIMSGTRMLESVRSIREIH